VAKRISYYDVAWDRRSGQGVLRLTFDDRTQAELRSLSGEELGLSCALLRLEKPIAYDEANETFSTDSSLIEG
jgi:hypothetical protein